MFFIVAGEVEVELPDEDNVRLSDGDFFGEIALLTTGIHQATVRTVDETQLLVLPSHDLERLMDRVPEIGRRIREIAHERAPDRMASEERSQHDPGR